MFRLIHELLSADDYMGKSGVIDFAKGSNKMETGILSNFKQAKRRYKCPK